MIIDVHCHYTLSRLPAHVPERFSFEPAVVDGQPAYDSFISPRADQRLPWRLARWVFKLDPRLPPGEKLDRQIAAMYERHLELNDSSGVLADEDEKPAHGSARAIGGIDRFVLLAFDDYHDDAGRRPPLPREPGDFGGDIYTSNSLIRAMCRRYPRRFLFGASVHPYRTDAVRCVEEVFAAGACLLKWLPLHQNININDPRTLAVLRRCADLGLPVLVHYNEEFTLATQHPEYQPVYPLLDVLRRLRREGAMPPVIVAHVATPVSAFGTRGSWHALMEALESEFAAAPLYADISALTAKSHFLRPVAERQKLHSKLLFGTDFPVPVAWPLLRGVLGRDYQRIAANPSWPQAMLQIFRHVGFNEIVFHRTAEILPHVDFFAAQSEQPSATTM